MPALENLFPAHSRLILIVLPIILLACYPTRATQILSGADVPTVSALQYQKSYTHALATATKAKPTIEISIPFPPSPSPLSPVTPSPLPTASFSLCSPLAPHPLSEIPEIVSGLYAPPPPGKEEERHHGVDFSYYRRGDRESILGAGVQSVLSGRVVASLNDSFPYGNMVIIETPSEALSLPLRQSLEDLDGESLYLLYAHLDQPPLVTLGEEVQVCQALGQVGKSGNAGVAHLHLETRLGPPGAVFTGMQFYDTRASDEERENYLLWRISGVYHHFDPMRLLLWQGP